jgi:hypothetical protein
LGNIKIDDPLSVVTSALALAAITPSATAKLQRPGRNAFHFTVPIALLLSNRLIPHSSRSERPQTGDFPGEAPQKCGPTYSKYGYSVKEHL